MARSRSLVSAPPTLSLLLVFRAWACPAEEIVQLKNGFSIHADSHTQQANNLLFRVGSGTIELAADDVAGIEVSSPIPASTKLVPDSQPSPEDLHSVLIKAANAEGVDPALVQSVAKIESDFRQDAISKKGALGLMQLMPSTAKGLGVDATSVRENALGGARYLRALLVEYRYNSALALAAYNAGPGAIRRFGGVPPYEETRKYVAKVTREYDRQVIRTTRTAKLSNTPIAKD